jgi:hypothetical protein
MTVRKRNVIPGDDSLDAISARSGLTGLDNEPK